MVAQQRLEIVRCLKVVALNATEEETARSATIGRVDGDEAPGPVVQGPAATPHIL